MANAATTPCHVFAFALAGLGGVAFERMGNYDAV